MSSKTSKSPVSSVTQPLPKIGMIFLGRRRPGFDMEWGAQQEAKARAFLAKAGFPVVEPEKAVDEISMRRAVAVCQENGAQAIVLFQGTMGDGRLAPTLAQLWPDPIILWASAEKQDGDMISACTLVGAHCWGSVLRQMGHSFDFVYGDPSLPETQKRFTEAARMAATIRALRSVRLGMIGGQAPGYFAMGGEPFAIYRGLGTQMQTYSLIEFSNALNDLNKDAVAEDVQKIKALGLAHKDTTDEDLPMASRLYLTMKQFMDNEKLDAMTVRCWPEMPNTFGQWPYVGIGRLVEEGRAVACEGDADGALSAWIGESLGFGRCYLSDWLEHDSKAKTITIWHGGAAPTSLCAPVGKPGGPKIARHFNIKKPAVIEATLRENMPITLCRFWRCDGEYYLSAREGQTIKPKRHLMGTNGVARLDNQDPHAWFDELCHNGMPHHLCVFEGRNAELLNRFAKTLNMHVI